MTEYIVVLALVVIAAISTYSYFGQAVRSQVAGLAKEIAGESASTEIQQSQSAANNSSNEAGQDIGLANYDEGTRSN